MSVTDSQNEATPKKRGRKPVKVTKRRPERTAEEITAIADDLLVWVDQPKNQIFEQFYKKHKISKSMWNDWREKNEYVKQAHEIAQAALTANVFDKTIECPSRGIFALKSRFGWHEMEDIVTEMNAVKTFQELKEKARGGA
jgi:hypothetical protein